MEKIMRGIVFAAALIVCVVVPATAESPRNLALNCSYALTPVPNYGPTRGESDQTELTDGYLVPQKNNVSLWIDEAAVGWSRPRDPITITLDLGQIESIGGVAFDTAFGSAGVSAPRSIAILVSDDGEQFNFAGDLIRLSNTPMPPAYGTYVRHIYRANTMQTKGRFIRFVVVPSGRFIFCDEISVFEGEHAIESVTQSFGSISMPQIKDSKRLTQLGAYARIRTDLEAVGRMVGVYQLDPTLKEQIVDELISGVAKINALII